RDPDGLVRRGAVPGALPQRGHDGHVDPVHDHPGDAPPARLPMVSGPRADPRLVRRARVSVPRRVRPRARVHGDPDYPWTLVIPSTLIAGAVGLGVGSLVNPTLTNAFFTGAGYFVQSKVVTTIAEDQAPGMSQMIL